MRVTFSSLAFPLKAADRLAYLLPALSVEQAQDWTAQVYGYRNWQQLSFEVDNLSDSVIRSLAPELKYSLDCYRASCVSEDTRPCREQQMQMLHKLLGWTRKAAARLYVEWEPRGYWSDDRTALADLGPGTPAFQLVQRNVFPSVPEPGAISLSEAAYVYLGFSGPAEQLHSAAESFLAKLPEQFLPDERRELAVDLSREHQNIPEVWPVHGPNTFAQVFPMTFIVCRPDDDKEIIGAAFVTFALIASCDGTHSVKISLKRVVSLPGEEHLSVLADAMAVTMWEAVIRYLWCTVGNADKEALVLVEYPADARDEALVALEMLDLIVGKCGWPGRNERPEIQGIRFELSSKSADHCAPAASW
jgi:hypothetical protein